MGGVKSLCSDSGRLSLFPPLAVWSMLSIIVIMANKYAAQVLAAWPHRWFDGAKIRKVFEKAVKTVLIITLKYVNNKHELI